jgi:hypothetical protein
VIYVIEWRWVFYFREILVERRPMSRPMLASVQVQGALSLYARLDERAGKLA